MNKSITFSEIFRPQPFDGYPALSAYFQLFSIIFVKTLDNIYMIYYTKYHQIAQQQHIKLKDTPQIIKHTFVGGARGR